MSEIFEQKNELAMENLFLALDYSFLFNVAEEKTIEGILDKLCDIYEGKSMSNQIHFRRNLYILRRKRVP